MSRDRLDAIEEATTPSAPTPGPPARTTVATYDNYRDAERAVDFLSDKGFPVQRAAIVGTGLRTVEQIAGRITTGRAALMGAGQGAMIGLIFALLIGVFFTVPGAHSRHTRPATRRKAPNPNNTGITLRI